MVTKLVKNEVMPISSPAFSSSGREAVKPVDGDEARPHQIGGRQRGARRLQAEPGERLEDDVGQALEVVEQQGEEADVEDLADQLRQDVVLAHQRPEQAGQRDVDGHQHAGQEGDVAREQPEAGIDVAAEGLGEAVDDGEVVHGPPEAHKAPPLAPAPLPALSSIQSVVIAASGSCRRRAASGSRCRPSPCRRRT